MPTESRNGEEGVLAQESAERVRTAVAALPPVYREVLVLADYEDLKMTEIAAITGAELGNVKVRLHRARQQVRRLLEAMANEPG